MKETDMIKLRNLAMLKMQIHKIKTRRAIYVKFGEKKSRPISGKQVVATCTIYNLEHFKNNLQLF